MVGKLLLPRTATGLCLTSFALIASLYSGIIHCEKLVLGRTEPAPPIPGVTAEPLPSRTTGLVVTSVRDRSEAQLNGIAVGDDILRVNDLPAKSNKSRRYYLSKTDDGLLRLQLLHDRMVRTVVLHPVAR